MTYTTKEAADKLRISKDTLLYYEKEGLLPEIERDEKKRRIYSESDIEWIFLIRCLRDTDMPISKIKQYIFLLKNVNDDSVQERRKILLEHQIFIQEKIETYRIFLELIEKKISFYDDAMNSSNSSDVKCSDYKTEWESFRQVLGEQKYDKS